MASLGGTGSLGGAGANRGDTGGTPAGGMTSGGQTSGGQTSGGQTSGGQTSGGQTSGGQTSGGQTSGGQTSGGQTSGGQTSGGQTSGGQTSTAGTGNQGSCPVELVGWATTGTGTTGGGDAPPQTVTSIAELEQLAGDDTARVLHFTGTLDTGSGSLVIKSNKTLLGLDKTATIKGGITISGASNIILRNFTVVGAGNGGSPVDAIGARGSNHIWFDHLAVRDGPDGTIDLTRGSDHATVSWCKFWYEDLSNGHRLALLFGGGSTHGDTDTGKNNHTVHHNWFSVGVKSRAPRLLFGKGHIFNNFYNTEDNSYCIGSGSWSSLLVENNYFKDTNSPHKFQDGNPSYIEAVGNVYVNTKGDQHTGNGGSGNNPPGPWTPTYEYRLDPADSVPDLVTRCAGPQ